MSRSVGIFNFHTPQNPTSLRHVLCYPQDHWGVYDKDWGCTGVNWLIFGVSDIQSLLRVRERERERGYDFSHFASYISGGSTGHKTCHAVDICYQWRIVTKYQLRWLMEVCLVIGFYS